MVFYAYLDLDQNSMYKEDQFVIVLYVNIKMPS